MSEHNNEDYEMEQNDNGGTEEKVQYTSLGDLLSQNFDRAQDEVTVEMVNGGALKLPIVALLADEERAIRKRATRKIGNRRAGFSEETNDLMYNCLIIDKITDKTRTDINWSSQELAKQVGAKVNAPELVIPKVVSIGGIVALVEAGLELSGLNDSFENKVEAAKN